MNHHKKHLLIMVLCCLIPIGAVTAIRLFNIPVTQNVYLGVMLLCPVLHIVLMKMMMTPPRTEPARQGHSLPAEPCHTAPELGRPGETLRGPERT